MKNRNTIVKHQEWYEMNNKKIVALSIIALAIVGGVVLAIANMKKHPALAKSMESNTAQTVDANLMTASYVTTPKWLEVIGTVGAEYDAPVSSRVMGLITQVNVHEGDVVRKGETLVTLDKRDLQAGIEQAQANLHSAKVGYQNAIVAEKMGDAMSKAKISAAQAAVRESEAAFKAAQAKQELVFNGPRKQQRVQASLGVIQAKAELDLAQSDFTRMKNLYRQGAISKQQYDTYNTQLQVAQAQYNTAVQSQSMTEEGSRKEDIQAANEGVSQATAAYNQAEAGLKQAIAGALQVNVLKGEMQSAAAGVRQAQAALQIAEVGKDYASVQAPFNGVVEKRMADPGAFANPGVPLLMIQGGALRIEAIVPENALSIVHLGDNEPVFIDALNGKEVMGKVVEISPQGNQASHTFVVKLQLPSNANIRSGMYGRVRFQFGTEKRLLVPSTALIELQGLHYVFVVNNNNIARLRIVTIGQPMGNKYPILSGVNPGERVIMSGTDRIKDGDIVQNGSASS